MKRVLAVYRQKDADKPLFGNGEHITFLSVEFWADNLHRPQEKKSHKVNISFKLNSIKASHIYILPTIASTDTHTYCMSASRAFLAAI